MTDLSTTCEALTRAFNERDTAGAGALLAPGAALDRGDGAIHDGEAVAAGLRAVFAAVPDARLRLGAVTGFGAGAALAEWRLIGTRSATLAAPCPDLRAPGDGARIDLAVAAVLETDRQGRITRIGLRGDLAALAAPPGMPAPLPEARRRQIAEDLAAAWTRGDPVAVGALYAEDAWFVINGGAPHCGRSGITAMAAGFMDAFPGLDLSLEGFWLTGDGAAYGWTLTGRNTGPGGTGQAVRFSGIEIFTIGQDGLIARSRGYYDSAAYAHQVEYGVP